MKVSSRGYGDAVRGLGHGKGAKVSTGRGTPSKREGSDGDLTLRSTQRGVILYAKYGGQWYSIHTQQSLVSGMIIMWSGDATQVPPGWALCNGSQATPDLRARFIIGSGSSSDSGGTYSGGENDPFTIGTRVIQAQPTVGAWATTAMAAAVGTENHTLTIAEIPAHAHTYSNRGSGSTDPGGSTGYNVYRHNTTLTSGATGGGGTHAHGVKALTIPEKTVNASANPSVDWYCLAYIMFLGGGAEPGSEGSSWGGGSSVLGRE